MPSPNIIDLPLRKRNAPPIIEVEDLSLWYGGNRALDCVSFEVFPGEVLALIGGPGCGLSTALACLNGSLEDSPCVEMAGEIRVNGQRVGGGAQGSAVHRCRIGWVARHPDLPAGSMFNNVARYAQKHGLFDSAEDLAAHVEACLRRAHLWEAVNGDVHGRAAASLPAALRMRLGLARAMSARPDLVLLDEPTCGLAPDAAAGINAVMADIKRDHTLVIATRCMRQVQEIADRVAFFHMGRLLELRDTAMFFAAPATPEAQSFVAGYLG